MAKARFVEPMLLLKTETLPEGKNWEYQLKLDGYRAIAYKSGGRVQLRSRNNKDFSERYRGVLTGLAGLADDTILDGEIVALDGEGRPSFNALQNSAGEADVHYFVFDLLMLGGEDLMREAHDTRRAQLEKHVLPVLKPPVHYTAPLDAPLRDLVHSVREQALEGLVAKRRDSRYEPGLRSGAWQKMRISRGEEFVIGGYTVGMSPFDALILGYYDADKRLLYAARTRNGFTPATRAALFRKFKGLDIAECPFANLPETKSGRWGQGLTAAKMKDCRWLKPVLAAQIEFVEWTADGHLRHSRFMALR